MTNPKTILVVDDEPRIVELARDYLEHAGFAVLTAADGPSALAAAVCLLLDDRALATRLAAEARSRALSRFSREAMVERTLALYGKTIDS